MKKILISLTALLCAATLSAQTERDPNPVITAMPSLSIAPDARAAGMADLGVATEADFNSQFWNPAKYAYMYSKGGITANYTPWLRKLVGDIDLAYLAGFYNFGDLAGGIGASFTYFSMGDVALTDMSGSVLENVRPNEWAIDLSYFRKLHEYVSMSVAVRFLYSDLNNGQNSSVAGATEMHPAWTMAADIGLYYRQPLELPMGTSHLALGFTLKNLGGKMTYADDGSSNFIPTSGNLGIGYELPCDKYNFLTFNLETSKLLVPTRYSKFAPDQTTGKYTQEEYSDINPAKGWFQSLHDAPLGFKEEFDEVRWSAGIEYSYNKQFFARMGYSYEDYYKGNRNVVTFGAGFHLSIVAFDFSYCVGIAPSNPLDQTMRFSLGFDLAGIKDLVDNKK